MEYLIPGTAVSIGGIRFYNKYEFDKHIRLLSNEDAKNFLESCLKEWGPTNVVLSCFAGNMEYFWSLFRDEKYKLGVCKLCQIAGYCDPKEDKEALNEITEILKKREIDTAKCKRCCFNYVEKK